MRGAPAYVVHHNLLKFLLRLNFDRRRSFLRQVDFLDLAIPCFLRASDAHLYCIWQLVDQIIRCKWHVYNEQSGEGVNVRLHGAFLHAMLGDHRCDDRIFKEYVEVLSLGHT